MSAPEMEFGDLTVQSPQPRPRPSSQPGVEVEPKGEVTPATCRIYLPEDVLADIVSFSAGYPDREVGGLLAGGVFTDGGRDYVVVSHFLRALHARSGPASLVFTHDTFEAAWRELQRKDPGGELLILGWHHTHPGYGTFLSEMDLFIQRNFFDLPWQIALVVDSKRGELTFFGWEDGAVRSVGFFLIHPAGGNPPS